MRKHVTRGLTAVAFLSILVVGSPALATWMPLTLPNPLSIDDIQALPSGQLVVGNKIFSAFQLTGIASSGGAIAPNESSVYIEGGLDTATGNYGIRILLAMNAFANQTANANLSFKVAATNPAKLNGVSMVLSGASATGTGGVNASETIFSAAPPSGPIVATLDVSRQSNGALDQLSDSSAFTSATPLSEIWVRKDISVTGGTEGAAHLSEVFQLFSDPVQVPEPTSVVMMGTGFALIGGLVIRRRKRRTLG